MSLAPVDLIELRPLDRVLAFVDYNIPPEKKRAGAKLPTTREVSELLDVSPATVRNAYQLLVQRGLARSDIGSGTYWTNAVEEKPGNSEIVIGVNSWNVRSISQRLEKKLGWGDRILGGVVQGMFNHGFSLRLKAVQLVDENGLVRDQGTLRDLLAGINTFIVVPFDAQATLAELLEKRGIATVCVNPPALNSTSNFVSPDYLTASKRVGMAFATAGRKRVLLFLAPGTRKSQSCQMRLTGFVAGLHSHESAPEFRTLTVQSDDLAKAKAAFEKLLDDGWIPDAVYTAGDNLALATMEVAKRRGISVPKELSVVAGTGLSVGVDGRHSSLTAMVQPMEQIGQELATMILKQRKDPESRTPGVMLPIGFWIGKTTLPQEDEILSGDGLF